MKSMHLSPLYGWLMKIPWCVALSRWECRLPRCSTHFLCEGLFLMPFVILIREMAMTFAYGQTLSKAFLWWDMKAGFQWKYIDESWCWACSFDKIYIPIGPNYIDLLITRIFNNTLSSAPKILTKVIHWEMQFLCQALNLRVWFYKVDYLLINLVPTF